MQSFIELVQNNYYAPISFELGFNIKKIVSNLPLSHQIWEEQAKKLADNIATFKIKDEMLNMPILHADAANIPDESLLRASILVSGFAHAFYYPTGFSEGQPLPNSILVPLLEISQRINKKINSNQQTEPEVYVGRTYLEDFLGNWVFNSPTSDANIRLDDIRIEKLKLLVPYFNNREELVSTLVTGPLMQAQFAPVIELIAKIENELQTPCPDIAVLTAILDNIKNCLVNTRSAFMLMSPKLGNPNYVDQVIWPQTSPTIGKKAHPNEAPNTGADSPIFHIMDKLLNRISYDSKMGKNINDRFNALVENHQKIINQVAIVGKKLFDYTKKINDARLNKSYAALVLYYAGSNGFLDAHRKKAYGYLKMSFLAGRLSTNGKEQGNANTTENKLTGLTPWARLNLFFIHGMEERLQVLDRLQLDYQSINLAESEALPHNKKSFKTFDVPALATRNNLIGIYKGKVFDLNRIAKIHPGGDRIIKSISGTDFTKEFEQAHHNDPHVLSMLKKDYLGDLSEPSENIYLQNFLDSWTNVLFLISAVQNNIDNIWHFNQREINDKSRFVPFQFVMKTLDIIFGKDGYFESLFDFVDTKFTADYKEKTSAFSDETGNPLKLTEIGKLAIKIGISEIKNRKLSTVEDTYVNNLFVYKFYSKIIQESFVFLDNIKTDIISQLNNLPKDEILENDLAIYHKKIKELLTTRLEDFITIINKPETMALLVPKQHKFNLGFLTNFITKLDLKNVLAGLTSLSVVGAIMRSDDNYLKFKAALVISGGMITNYFLKHSIFTKKPNSVNIKAPEQEALNIKVD